MTRRLSESWFPAALTALGLAVLAAGFGYDRLYAGLPHRPDAPIDLLMQWDRNRLFAARVYRSGGVLLAAGLAATAVQLVARSALAHARRAVVVDDPRSTTV